MTSGISRRGFLGTTAGAAALSVTGLRPAHAAFPERGVLFIGAGTAVTFVCLGLAGWLLVRLLQRNLLHR